MAVAIIPSVSQPPAADPIVHLAGGPGVDALAQAPTLVAAGLNHNRDLIIMDQRGNFHDEPALTCPEIDQFNALAVGLPYDSPSTEALHLAATQACHDRLVADGVDLSSYHTPENEADFADLRKVLKIKQWDVYGYSYGTDLALSLMRDYPKGIRSVILDSVVPPSVASLGWSWTNINEAFNNLFSACAAQSTCTSEYGNLSSLFTSLVQQLEANPVTTTAEPPQGGPPVAVVIDGGTLVNWVVGPQPILKISELPSAIYALSQNNPAPIATTRAVFTDPEGTGQFGYGLDYGVFCSEWVPYQPESEILVQGLLAFPTYPTSVLSQAPQLPYMTEDCAIWNVRAAPPSVRQVTISSIPTLLIDGSFDARTSPQWAVYAAGTLQNSTNIVIPGVVHFVLPKSPCAQSVVASFLSNPTAPDTSCVASLTPPIFN